MPKSVRVIPVFAPAAASRAHVEPGSSHTYTPRRLSAGALPTMTKTFSGASGETASSTRPITAGSACGSGGSCAHVAPVFVDFQTPRRDGVLKSRIPMKIVPVFVDTRLLGDPVSTMVHEAPLFVERMRPC